MNSPDPLIISNPQSHKNQPAPHICLASIPLSTSEHLVAIADQAAAAGFTTCWLRLDAGHAAPHTDLPEGGAGDDDMVVIDDFARLESHFAATSPVAVFIQSPYPEHYPEWFWASKWNEHFCFAGYGATLSTWEAGLYELPTLRNCEWLLAESEYNRDKYLAHGNDPDRVVVTGNPLMYELRSRLPFAERTDAPTLLWAPHWTSSWFELPRGFSRWKEAVRPILAFARAHPDAQVIARPHPLLHPLFLGLSNASALADDEDEVALRELLSLENVSLSDRSFVDDILRSDALVTDGVSIIAYYAATGKPLAIVRDLESPPFNEVGEELCAASDIVADPRELDAWLDAQFSNRFAGLSPERQRLSGRLHPTWPRSPVSIWAERAGLLQLRD